MGSRVVQIPLFVATGLERVDIGHVPTCPPQGITGIMTIQHLRHLPELEVQDTGQVEYKRAQKPEWLSLATCLAPFCRILASCLPKHHIAIPA